MSKTHDALIAAGWSYTRADGYTMRFEGVGKNYVGLVSEDDGYGKLYDPEQEVSAVLCDENDEPIFGPSPSGGIDYTESIGPVAPAKQWAKASVIKAMQAKARKLTKVTS